MTITQGTFALTMYVIAFMKAYPFDMLNDTVKSLIIALLWI